VNTAEKIYKAVMSNLYSRSGYDHLWDSIDEDVQEEVKQEVTAVIQRVLDKEI
jgi:hypothetical protein